MPTNAENTLFLHLILTHNGPPVVSYLSYTREQNMLILDRSTGLLYLPL